MSGGPTYVHASAVVVGETGVLIRGPSGSGKSALALALLDAATPARFARLVGDDRIGLTVRRGRLVARGHPAIAGAIERRGVGLVRRPHETAAAIGLVVDLVLGPGPERLPEESGKRVDILGVFLPRLALAAASAGPDAVLAALADAAIHATKV